MQQLNIMDSSFLHMDQPNSGMHGTMLQIYAPDKTPDITQRYQSLVERVTQAIPHIPLLHQKVYRVPADADKPYWVHADDIDLNYHIRHQALPPPGNWDQLVDVFENVCATPMNLDLPLWQIFVIEGLNGIKGLPKDSFAVIMKMHHAGADGVTGTKVGSVIAGAPLSEAADDESAPLNLQPDFKAVIKRGVYNHLDMSYKLGRAYIKNIPPTMNWAKNRILRSSSKKTKIPVPVTRFNQSLSFDRVYGRVIFSLEEFKSLSEKLGSIKINDIALTICAGALREYLMDKGELPDESMAAFMPVDVRQEEVGGNQFALAAVTLYTSIKSPLKRLKKIHQEASSSKRQLDSPGGNKVAEIGGILPEYILGGLLRNLTRYQLIEKMPPMANCLVTNLTGPRKAISTHGNTLVYTAGAPPIINGLGLEFLVQSYNGDMVISIISCRKMMPDKTFMEACLKKAFQLLKDAVNTQISTAKKRTTKKPKKRPTAQ